MIDSEDSARAAKGPQLVGAHKGIEFMAQGLAWNNGRLEAVTQPTDSELDAEIDLKAIIEAARMEGVRDYIATEREWLRACGARGFLSQSVAWAASIGVPLENITYSQFARECGCEKARASAARERLQSVYPGLRAAGQHAADVRKNLSIAMKEKWRKKKPDLEARPNPAGENTTTDTTSAAITPCEESNENTARVNGEAAV